jgi:ribose/xylose/arabinose/galactoside ABC-type transport system permease subunit
MIGRIVIFVVAAAATFVVLKLIFGVYCYVGGHNLVEASYGGVANVVIPLIVAFECAWLLPKAR